ADRHLHSFPTRRSSDLSTTRRVSASSRKRAARTCSSTTLPSRRRASRASPKVIRSSSKSPAVRKGCRLRTSARYSTFALLAATHVSVVLRGADVLLGTVLWVTTEQRRRAWVAVPTSAENQPPRPTCPRRS